MARSDRKNPTRTTKEVKLDKKELSTKKPEPLIGPNKKRKRDEAFEEEKDAAAIQQNHKRLKHSSSVDKE